MKSWLNLGFWVLAGLFALRHWELLADNHWYLFHDNHRYHFPSFVTIVNSLVHGFGFPHINLEWGGSDASVTSVSMGYFAPHRLLGYGLYWLFPITPLQAYKLHLLLGSILSGFGWFCLWRKVLPREELALFGAFAYFCSGIAITVWHQEQALVTIFYVPWILLLLHHFFHSGRGLVLVAALMGAALTLHYPQIHLVAVTFFLVALILLKRQCLKDFMSKLNRNLVLASLGIGLLAVAPSIYGLGQSFDYGSPLREAERFGATSLEEYVRVGTLQDASAKRGYFRNLVRPQSQHTSDQALFYVTRTGVCLAILGVLAGVFYYTRVWSWLVLFGIGVAWASLGFRAFLAQVLFVLHFPTISQFRQWYHFGPYVMICMVTLVCLGLYALMEMTKRVPNFIRYPVLIGIGLLMTLETQMYYSEYIEKFRYYFDVDLPRFTKDEYLRYFSGQGFVGLVPLPSPATALVALHDNMKFFGQCNELPEGRAWAVEPAVVGELHCSTLAQLRPIGFPHVVFTPKAVRLSAPDRSPEDLILGLNSRFFKDHPAIRPLGTTGLSVVRWTEPLELPLKGFVFLATLLVQALALGLGLVELCRPKVQGATKKFPPSAGPTVVGSL